VIGSVAFLTGVILVLVGAAIFLSADLYRSGRREVLNQFQSKQALLAQQAVQEATVCLRDFSQDLQTVAGMAATEGLDPVSMAAKLQAYSQANKHPGPLAIRVIDRYGALADSIPLVSAATNYARCEFFSWARKKDHQGRVHVSALTGEDGDRERHNGQVVVSTPWYRPRESKGSLPEREWAGVLSATLDLGMALNERLSQWTSNASPRVWIMDTDGTILLHSEHPEMARESIQRVDTQCYQCHQSFDYAERMLAARQPGLIEYQLKDQPKRLASYVPMHFWNATWVLVVSAPYHEVTAFVQRNFLKMLLLLGILATALVLACGLVYQTNLSKIRAQREAEQWQEKLHSEEKLRRAEERYMEWRNAQVRQDAGIKTTLLHEVNHRVKNNLLRLVEIVRLQREHAAPGDAGLRLALADVENRLHGMEVLHSMLAKAQWKPLPINELVTQIVTAGLHGSPIRRQIHLTVSPPPAPLWVPPEYATAVALILNELTTNSVKYAFRDRAEGHLEVRVRIVDRNRERPLVRLEYRDDGPGWPEPVLAGHSHSVGLHLIQASVRSPLRGKLTLRNDRGAVAELEFKLAALESPKTHQLCA
jgi:two-component sensor histidine kinase